MKTRSVEFQAQAYEDGVWWAAGPRTVSREVAVAHRDRARKNPLFKHADAFRLIQITTQREIAEVPQFRVGEVQ